MLSHFYKSLELKTSSTSTTDRMRTFIALSWEEMYIFFLALLFLPVFHCCTKLLPLSVLIRLFNLKKIDHTMGEQQLSTPPPFVYTIKRAIEVIDHRVPFWPGLCFAQALTARTLLHRYNIPCILYLGARRHGESSMQAHAWLCVGNHIITGSNSMTSSPPLIALM